MANELRKGAEELFEGKSDEQICEDFGLPTSGFLHGTWALLPEGSYDIHKIPSGITKDRKVVWAPGPGLSEFMYVGGITNLAGFPTWFVFKFVKL